MAAIDLPGLTAKAPAGPLATLLGQTVETAQDGAIPGDFAAMLAASQTAGIAPASLLPIMPAPASGKPGGKAGGKSLPDDLPLAAMNDGDDLPETAGEELAIPADTAIAQPPVAMPMPALPSQPAPQALPAETPPAAETPRGPAAPLPAAAALPQSIAAQVARIVAGQDGPRSAAPAAPVARATVQVAAVGVAFELPAALPALPAQPAQPALAAQPVAPAAAPAMVPVAALLPRGNAAPAASAETASPARRVAAAGPDLPTMTAMAAIELPAEAMALRTDMVPAAATPAPQSATPATPAAPTPHDFAALVDRLVEARDAAFATQSPQVVQSTLRHADFGQVSIRFETAGDGLSASLSSPDPEFARAVQASAATGQGSLTADQQGGQARQDGNAAQPSFAQSQQRSPGQQGQAAEARWRDAPASSAEPRGDHSDNPAAPQGRGIYA